MIKKQKLKNKYFIYFYEIIGISIFTYLFTVLFVYKALNDNEKYIPFIKINNENIYIKDINLCNVELYCYNITVRNNDKIVFENPEFPLAVSGSNDKFSFDIDNSHYAYTVNGNEGKFYVSGDKYLYKFMVLDER